MLLKEYLKKNDIDVFDFAKLCGKRPQTIYNYMTGDRSPTLSFATVIVNLTHGEVTFEDLIAPYKNKYVVDKDHI